MIDRPTELLRIEGLCCDYGGQPAVVGVSLTLGIGQLGCLLGPSGCGKTTLLRAVAGFHQPSRGQILLRGIDVTRLPPEQRRIGFVFQDLALFPHLTVAGNVAFGLRKLSRAERAARVADTLAPLGLSAFAERYPHELSGGQQQRVALARSLAPRPDLLLLDEPFSSLDADLRGSLRDELRRVLNQLGIAALLVTHDQEEAFSFGDRVGVMRDGELLQWDSGFDVYHRPADPFVARFVGEGRFLDGTVVDARQVDTALGRLTSSSQLDFAPGTRVRVLLRPDDLRSCVGHGFSVEVTNASFRGAEHLYTLKLSNGESAYALLPSHQRFEPGQRMNVCTDIEHVVVFPGEARQAR
ncbi:MAG: ABC transporter ATP-binding protein [Xanthomonadaceae bacterium]|nr:ABC transporter ATP-binding protein [Xanthomonadaceae bacterium]